MTDTLLRLGGQRGLMTISSKNPTKKKYQAAQKLVPPPTRINVDCNRQPRPVSGSYMTCQNSRQNNAILKAPTGDQEDIRHILDSYDRRDAAQKSKEPPSPAQELDTLVQIRGADETTINKTVFASPRDMSLTNKLSTEVGDPMRKVMGMEVILQESKSSKSISNAGSASKPPQAPMRKHMTMAASTSRSEI
jgi:hypothetical protein